MFDVGEGCMMLKDPKHLGTSLKICPAASDDLCIQCFMHSVFHSDVCHDTKEKTCRYFRFSNFKITCSCNVCVQLALLPHYFPTILIQLLHNLSSPEL